MKKLTLSILLLTTIIFTSCGGSETSKVDINNIEGIKSIKSIIETQFGPETEIYALRIQTKDHLTSEFNSAIISYLDNGVDYSRLYITTAESGKELQEAKAASKNFQKQFFLKSKQGKLKIKDLDFNQIVTKYNEAVALIDPEYESFSLNTWKYLVNNKGQLTSQFTIEGTKKGEGTNVEGRNIVTNYYDFKFEMNTKGEVVFKD